MKRIQYHINMIEDDDSFKQNETLRREPEEQADSKRPIMLFIFIAWIIWTLLLSIYFLPKVKQAVEDSGVITLIEDMKSREESPASHRDVNVGYITYEGVRIFNHATERRGSDKYHDTIEALINDYPYEALKEGAVSLINPKTKLIGLTAGNGICYVDLSKAFLDSRQFREYTAVDQIKETLLSYEEISKVVILIEGEVLSESHYL